MISKNPGLLSSKPGFTIGKGNYNSSLILRNFLYFLKFPEMIILLAQIGSPVFQRCKTRGFPKVSTKAAVIYATFSISHNPYTGV